MSTTHLRPAGGAERDMLDLLGGRATSFLRGVLDASPDCIKIIELDGALSFMNENGRCAMEIDDFCAVDGAMWWDLWPAEAQATVGRAVDAARRGEQARFEAFCPTAKGSPRWWDVSVAPVPGPTGRPERIISISRDVTERVERERAIARHEAELERLTVAQAATLQQKEELLAEKDLLMREVDHRVKNSLALVNSLLSMQARGAVDETVREALTNAAQRVGSIASLHEKLYKGRTDEVDLAPYVAGLAADLERSVGEGFGIAVRAECDSLVRPAEVASVIGLIVAELVTNAVRHGLEGRRGTVRVALRRAGEGFVLIVADDGRGLPEGFDLGARHGLGMRFVQSYVKRHGWTLSARNEGGACFTVEAG
jgi:PAS domain S-box-containing protein